MAKFRITKKMLRKIRLEGETDYDLDSPLPVLMFAFTGFQFIMLA